MVPGDYGTVVRVVRGFEARMLRNEVVIVAVLVRGPGSGGTCYRGRVGRGVAGDDDLCNTAEVREATGAESLTEVW